MAVAKIMDEKVDNKHSQLREKLNTFFNNTFVKYLALRLIVIVIGGICLALGAWDHVQDPAIFKKVIALIIYVTIYIVALAYYSVLEVNSNKMLRICKS